MWSPRMFLPVPVIIPFDYLWFCSQRHYQSFPLVKPSSYRVAHIEKPSSYAWTFFPYYITPRGTIFCEMSYSRNSMKLEELYAQNVCDHAEPTDIRSIYSILLTVNELMACSLSRFTNFAQFSTECVQKRSSICSVIPKFYRLRKSSIICNKIFRWYPDSWCHLLISAFEGK